VIRLLGMPGTTATVSLPRQGRRFNRATLDGRDVSGLLKGRSVKVAFGGKKLHRPWHRKLSSMERGPVRGNLLCRRQQRPGDTIQIPFRADGHPAGQKGTPGLLQSEAAR